MGCCTRRIPAVGAAAAAVYTLAGGGGGAAAAVSQQGFVWVELNIARLGVEQKLTLPINGRKYKHCSDT